MYPSAVPTGLQSLIGVAPAVRMPSELPRFINSTRTVINSTRTGINSTRTVINSTRTGTFLDDIFRTDRDIATKFSAQWPTADSNRPAKFGYAGSNGSDAIVRAAFHQFNPHRYRNPLNFPTAPRPNASSNRCQILHARSAAPRARSLKVSWQSDDRFKSCLFAAAPKNAHTCLAPTLDLIGQV